MTLTTHIVAGAAGARLFASSPVEGFIIGWLSHYVLDSIVHWDYPLASVGPEIFTVESQGKLSLKNRAVIGDFIKVIIDVCLGFFLAFTFLDYRTDPRYLLILAGGLGSVIPDFLQFIFVVWKNRFIGYFQKFHNMLHAKTDINDRPLLGITFQAALIIIILVLFNFTY